MITFNYDEVKYNLVTTWDEITLNQFLRIRKSEEKWKFIEVRDEIKAQELLEIFTNQPLGIFDEMPIGQVADIATNFIDLSDINNFFTQTFKIGELIEIDGKKYGYRTDYNQCTAGEVNDLQDLMREAKNDYDFLPDMAAILIRPVIEYQTEAGTKTYKLVKRELADKPMYLDAVNKMKAKDVIRVVSFFLSGWAELKETMRNYSKKEVEQDQVSQNS